MSLETTQTRKRTTTAWVVALTAIGSLMAALDTTSVSRAAIREPIAVRATTHAVVVFLRI